MKWPQCGKEIENPQKPSKPFCSDRCKLIDLGKWISGEYRIAADETDDSLEENPMAIEDTGEE